jgi:uncharacterized membrane protein
MHKPFFILLLLLSACTLPAEKEERASSKKIDTTVIETHDANAAISTDTSNTKDLPIAQKMKNPSGIYRTILPLGEKVEQTVLFNSDLTYQLQEKYINGKQDSIVTTMGNWNPSDGYIWLYKDQIVRGRYKWKGDDLQYFSPVLKKSFTMNHLQDAMQNAAWQNKAKQGVVIFGIGNEPFWSVEYTNRDTIAFLLSEWTRPLKMKVDSTFSTNDSTGYIAKNDSTQLRVTIFPHFCSDGMSDFTYRNKIKVHYNKQVYNGCGMMYQ